jgi:hypothetical protein
MTFVPDTNIFIYSLYNQNCNKIIKKFFSIENNCIPLSLKEEIENPNYYLHFEFNKILIDIKNNKPFSLDFLKKDTIIFI